MITGAQLRDSIISGANHITNLKSAVDELNVFPVPDGDTGTNMSMTINAALPELTVLPDDVSVEKVSQITSSALLRGARGNSGVILSLLFRGFSRALQGKETADSEDLYQSLRRGTDSAYKAVMKPTEGTMLTVARISAEKVEHVWQEKDPISLWAYIVELSRETLAETPELLPVLKKAGVVDSGGQGLVYIFEGMLSVLQNGILIDIDTAAGAPGVKKAEIPGTPVDPALANLYSIEFSVAKNDKANHEKLRAFSEAIGQHVVLTDTDSSIQCRMQTESPGRIITEALRHGSLTHIQVKSLLEQQLCGAPSSATPPSAASDVSAALHGENSFAYVPVDSSVEYGFVTVSAGAGLETLFHDLGVERVVNGGQTMNPSTEDILSAIHSVGANNVIVLANNKNIIMSAEQACKLSDRNAVVLPTRNIPQGIAAMLGFTPDASLEENIISMNQSADGVTSGQVTFAARDSDYDGHQIKEGEILALSNGKLLFTDSDISKTVVRLARKIVKKTTSFLTLIYGEDVREQDATYVAAKIREALPSHVEVTVVFGGQPVYYYYLSAE